MTGIWSIILAAGESRRMGYPKMLLEFRGKTMLENVIEHVAGSGTDGILVVLGANREKLTGIVENCGVRYCINDNYKEGMLSSVQCGIRNLPAGIRAVMVFQGDQPLIFPHVIDRLIEAYGTTGKGLVIPVYGGKRGHPLLIGSRYREEIDSLSHEEGLRAITGMHSEDILEVAVNDPGILKDFDTWDDYKTELNQT